MYYNETIMALFLSEDLQVSSWIRLELLKVVEESGQWLDYCLELGSRDHSLILSEHEGAVGRASFSLAPVNELDRFIALLQSALAGNTVTFEPQEPNFELTIRPERLGYSAMCFVDNGNSRYHHYTWDGFGLRFFTTRSNLERFLNELVAESKRFMVQPER